MTGRAREPRRYLITGGAGFIGSHLADALVGRGDFVAIIDDLSTGRFENIAHLEKHPRFQFALDSITNEGVIDRLASECEVIFHLAAAVGVELIVKDPVHVIETNILGTRTVLKAANRYRKKVLIASTSEIYGKNGKAPFHEESDRLQGPTTKSRWSYSTSKAIDEFLGLAYFRQMGLPAVIFRLFNTIGPRQTGQYGMVVPRFVQQALRGEPLRVFGDGNQTRCFCCVEDTVRGLLNLAECERAMGQVFNIGSTEEITILGLAQKVLELVHSHSAENPLVDPGTPGSIPERGGKSIVFIPYDQAYETGFEDMMHRVPDVGKIREFTGWEPRVGLEESLRRVIRFYQMEGENGNGTKKGQGKRAGNHV